MSFKSDATITVNGVTVQSGSVAPAVPLNVGANQISVQVSYPGAAVTTYTLNVTRLSQVDLTALALTASPSMNLTLSPAFRPLITAYTLAVPFTCTSVTVTPTPADPAATIQVAPGNTVLAPSSGATSTVTITVTSSDGKGSHAYTIVISRAALSYAPDTSWGSSGRIGSDLSGSGALNQPSSLSVAAGQVFIFDGRNYRVQNFTTTGSPVQRWGSYGSASGQFQDSSAGVAYDSVRGSVYVSASGLVQQFSSSNGAFVREFGSGISYAPRLACDSSGNVYVVDYSNNHILKFDSSGNLLLTWGSTGSGQGQFSYPRAVAIDSASNVYISDSSGRIQKFTSAGVYVTQWTSSMGQAQGIAVDSSNYLYVAGWNQTQKYDGNGNVQGSAWANPTNTAIDIATDSASLYYICNDLKVHKTGMSGGADISSWGSDLSTAASSLNQPQRVAVDASKNIYVSDTNNSRIKSFASNGTLRWTSSGTTLLQPYGIALDSSANVYVADSGNNRIVKFVGTTGTYDGSWNVTGVSLSSPRGIACDTSNLFYVADSSRIVRLSSNGSFQTSWTCTPNAVAVDANSNVYVADNANTRIQKYSNNGVFILQWGSQGSGIGKFWNVTDVTVDPTGGVFVPQANNSVQKFDSGGTYLLTYPANWDALGPQSVVGGAVDASGNLYFVDASDMSVRRFKPQ
jgi:hypothetical protein